jgi:hypothetical protein
MTGRIEIGIRSGEATSTGPALAVRATIAIGRTVIA